MGKKKERGSVAFSNCIYGADNSGWASVMTSSRNIRVANHYYDVSQVSEVSRNLTKPACELR